MFEADVERAHTHFDRPRSVAQSVCSKRRTDTVATRTVRDRADRTNKSAGKLIRWLPLEDLAQVLTRTM